jgi:uncharacterized membrane protein YeaQ/YmgE (transglycosylase-associated protein family)
MGILAWIIFGLIAGALAIVGAVIGGFVAVQLGYGDITGLVGLAC